MVIKKKGWIQYLDQSGAQKEKKIHFYLSCHIFLTYKKVKLQEIYHRPNKLFIIEKKLCLEYEAR